MLQRSRRKLIIAASSGLAFPAVSFGRTGSHEGEQQMYGLIGKLIAVSGQRDALIAVLLEGAGEMPGCLSYVVAKDQKDPNAIWVTEAWDSEQSHRASLSLPSVKQAIARGKPMIASFGEFAATEPVGGHGLERAGTR